MNRFEKNITKMWYQKPPSLISRLLSPLALIFRAIIALRRFAYRHHILPQADFSLPIIIVGNITVGGTGKTPLVISLCELLKNAGFTPGIATRGYRGYIATPTLVKEIHSAEEVGDEALLLKQRTGVDIAVARRRAEAVALLQQNPKINIILLDDGLQHYALARDIEIAVVDGERGMGNGYLLPAGPLRELPSRLNQVNFVLVNEQEGMRSNTNLPHAFSFSMRLAENVVSLADPAITLPLTYLADKIIHLVAGLGAPERFFKAMERVNLKFITHVFPDHHVFTKNDLDFDPEAIILMSEKDAVKCRRFADHRYWYIPAKAELNNSFCQQFLQQVEEVALAKRQQFRLF